IQLCFRCRYDHYGAISSQRIESGDGGVQLAGSAKLRFTRCKLLTQPHPVRRLSRALEIRTVTKKESHLRGLLEVILRSLFTSSTSLRSLPPPMSPDRLVSKPSRRWLHA